MSVACAFHCWFLSQLNNGDVAALYDVFFSFSDELESIKRYKERLEEKLLEHYKTMSSPKKYVINGN